MREMYWSRSNPREIVFVILVLTPPIFLKNFTELLRTIGYYGYFAKIQSVALNGMRYNLKNVLAFEERLSQ